MNDSADDQFANEACDVSFNPESEEDLDDDGLMETEETRLLGDDADSDTGRCRAGS